MISFSTELFTLSKNDTSITYYLKNLLAIYSKIMFSIAKLITGVLLLIYVLDFLVYLIRLMKNVRKQKID